MAKKTNDSRLKKQQAFKAKQRMEAEVSHASLEIQTAKKESKKEVSSIAIAAKKVNSLKGQKILKADAYKIRVDKEKRRKKITDRQSERAIVDAQKIIAKRNEEKRKQEADKIALQEKWLVKATEVGLDINPKTSTEDIKLAINKHNDVLKDDVKRTKDEEKIIAQNADSIIKIKIAQETNKKIKEEKLLKSEELGDKIAKQSQPQIAKFEGKDHVLKEKHVDEDALKFQEYKFGSPKSFKRRVTTMFMQRKETHAERYLAEREVLLAQAMQLDLNDFERTTHNDEVSLAVDAKVREINGKSRSDMSKLEEKKEHIISEAVNNKYEFDLTSEKKYKAKIKRIDRKYHKKMTALNIEKLEKSVEKLEKKVEKHQISHNKRLEV